MMLSILSCVCWQSIYLLWRNVYLGLLPIFGLGCLFFWYWAAWAACKFSRLILCQLLHLQIFSLILRAVFSSWVNSSLMIKWKCKFRENKSGYLEDNMHSEAIHVIVVSFAVQKFLSFIRSHLFIFVFISIFLGGGSKRILLWFMSYSVLPMI